MLYLIPCFLIFIGCSLSSLLAFPHVQVMFHFSSCFPIVLLWLSLLISHSRVFPWVVLYSMFPHMYSMFAFIHCGVSPCLGQVPSQSCFPRVILCLLFINFTFTSSPSDCVLFHVSSRFLVFQFIHCDISPYLSYTSFQFMFPHGYFRSLSINFTVTRVPLDCVLFHVLSRLLVFPFIHF